MFYLNTPQNSIPPVHVFSPLCYTNHRRKPLELPTQDLPPHAPSVRRKTTQTQFFSVDEDPQHLASDAHRSEASMPINIHTPLRINVPYIPLEHGASDVLVQPNAWGSPVVLLAASPERKEVRPNF